METKNVIKSDRELSDIEILESIIVQQDKCLEEITAYSEKISDLEKRLMDFMEQERYYLSQTQS